MWLLPSPARARRACPLPGQRLSIFSVFRKAVHANAQLFCSFGPQDREDRQPLDRERDLEKASKGVSFFMTLHPQTPSLRARRASPTDVRSRAKRGNQK